MGIGLWTEQPPSAPECTGLTERLRQDLSALAPNMNWEVDWMPHAADDEIFSLVARARLSLIELHQQTGEDFWDDAAQSFFNTAGKAVFSLPAEIWEKFRTLES